MPSNIPGIAQGRSRRGSDAPLIALNMDALPTAANRGDAIIIQNERDSSVIPNTPTQSTPSSSYAQMVSSLTPPAASEVPAHEDVEKNDSKVSSSIARMRESVKLKPRVFNPSYYQAGTNWSQRAIDDYAPGRGVQKARAIRSLNEYQARMRSIVVRLIGDRDDQPDFSPGP